MRHCTDRVSSRFMSACGLLLTTALLIGCKKDGPAESTISNGALAPASHSSPAVTSALSPTPTAAAVPHVSSAASTWPATLPRLKAVLQKPFPEGASEDVVCEAIANTAEKDLWVRFGHIVPMYIWGSIVVTRATAKDIARIDAFGLKYAGGTFYTMVKGCRGDTALIYARHMPENLEHRGQVMGREHYVQALKQELNIDTLESFGFRDDQQRLSDYCRADAELCEQLVKLDYANEGKGLCPSVLSVMNVMREDANYVAVLERCLKLVPSDLACVKFMKHEGVRETCRANLKKNLALGD